MFFRISSLFSQTNLIKVEAWKNKVNIALNIIKESDQNIFKEIVANSKIQVGELKEAGYAGFCEVEETSGGKILWIMIDVYELKNSSIQSISGLIIHEALHIKNRLHDLPGRNWGNFSYQEKLKEHVQIYNYELSFLKKINAFIEDIDGLKRLMIKEKIPIY
jgi:hypothetical protein